METIDFGPATRDLAQLVAQTPDDRLAHPTPCPDWTVADLVGHVGGLALAFTAAAHKVPMPEVAGPGDPSVLEPGWRTRIARDLEQLAEAWRNPAAYEGMTEAGGIDLPGDVAALVALDEVVVHGWDLSRATGLPYDPDPGSVARCRAFAESFETPPEAGDGPFGPPLPVAPDADELTRLIAATGRDAGWAPART